METETRLSTAPEGNVPIRTFLCTQHMMTTLKLPHTILLQIVLEHHYVRLIPLPLLTAGFAEFKLAVTKWVLGCTLCSFLQPDGGAGVCIFVRVVLKVE